MPPTAPALSQWTLRNSSHTAACARIELGRLRSSAAYWPAHGRCSRRCDATKVGRLGRPLQHPASAQHSTVAPSQTLTRAGLEQHRAPSKGALKPEAVGEGHAVHPACTHAGHVAEPARFKRSPTFGTCSGRGGGGLAPLGAPAPIEAAPTKLQHESIALVVEEVAEQPVIFAKYRVPGLLHAKTTLQTSCSKQHPVMQQAAPRDRAPAQPVWRLRSAAATALRQQAAPTGQRPSSARL